MGIQNLRTNISLSEKEEGYRLACQIIVKKDLSVKIPEELLSWEYNATVEKIDDVTHDIKSITLSFDKPMSFRAGQYIQLIIPPYSNIEDKTVRSYSLASPPSSKKNH
ncbi:MAG: hypothetical protein U9O65_04965 [Thermotogota bacterium]|nr:hypothetical protein [Thermotogota bacterium]